MRISRFLSVPIIALVNSKFYTHFTLSCCFLDVSFVSISLYVHFLFLFEKSRNTLTFH